MSTALKFALFCGAAAAAVGAQAQEPPADLLARVATAHAVVRHLGSTQGDSIWPGFRPDTIPILYVLPAHGTLLLGWRGALPEGFAPVAGAPDAGWRPQSERGAASTGTSLASRQAAQVVVHEDGIAALAGLTAHEAMHVFEEAAAQPGRRFGQGENSFLVTTYPVFDPVNEAGMALEGKLLGAALDARSARRLMLVRQFLAVRETRHRALGPEMAEFEQLAELNEGPAEYALGRTVQLAARQPGFADVAGARRIAAESRARLDSLTSNVTQSLRLRFYATGPAMARLLDAIAGPGWQTRLMRDDLTLQEALAVTVGYRDAERALVRQAEAALGGPALHAMAAAGVARLRSLRRAQVDTVLAAPGVLLEVSLDSLPGRRVGLCGFDPQNLLQVDEGIQLHMRFVRPCTGSTLQATFTTPLVQDLHAGTLRAVVGADSTLWITVGGRALTLANGQRLHAAADVQIEAPTVTLHAARVDLWREGRRLVLRVLPD